MNGGDIFNIIFIIIYKSGSLYTCMLNNNNNIYNVYTLHIIYISVSPKGWYLGAPPPLSLY